MTQTKSATDAIKTGSTAMRALAVGALALGAGAIGAIAGCIQWLESKHHAPSEEVRVLRPATAAISLSMPPKIKRCTG